MIDFNRIMSNSIRTLRVRLYMTYYSFPTNIVHFEANRDNVYRQSATAGWQTRLWYIMIYHTKYSSCCNWGNEDICM